MKAIDNIDFRGMKVELIGTFVFFYVGGWAVINSSSKLSSDTCSCALAHMITLGLMIWAGAHVSGHFNPAVTTCFIVFKRIHWITGLFYILAQLLGGLFSAALLKVIVSGDALDLANAGSINGFPKLTNAGTNWWKQCILEFIGTFFLMLTVYLTAVDTRAPENVHGMAIGGVVGFMLLATPPGFATALNPARAFCPMVIDAGAEFWTVFIWLVFPVLGAIAAGFVCEKIFLKGIDEEQNDAVELPIIVGNAGGEMEMDAGGELTTPMRATGTLDVELDAGLDVDADIGLGVGIGLGVDVDVDAEIEVDLEVDVEVDAAIDVAVWDTPDDTQKAAWKGFFVQGGEQNDMDLPNLQIGLSGAITGEGSDAVGEFTISGQLNDDGTFNFDKAYPDYTVSYNGSLDGTKLAGNWSLPDQQEEPFEISLVSSSWNGYFLQNEDKNDMNLNLGVANGLIFGTGTDGVGSFLCRGKSDGGDFSFVKKYLGAHQVLYFGKVEGGEGSRTVKGKWTIADAGIEDKFTLQES